MGGSGSMYGTGLHGYSSNMKHIHLSKTYTSVKAVKYFWSFCILTFSECMRAL